MPSAPKRYCLVPSCRNWAVKGGRCEQHQRKPQRSAEATEWRKLLNDRRWQEYRLAFLAEHPLCVDPFGEHEGRPVVATVVDHIQAHRGDTELFWDTANHQALCLQCNSRKAARSEGAFGR